MDFTGSLMGRGALSVLLALALATDAHAQNPEPLASFPSRIEFMSRFDFYMSAAGLSDPDPRFSWDTHWGGDFDFVDYVYGRLTFLADYQVVLGDEVREVDPNQGNYTLAASSSFRIKGTELAAVMYHQSRHLSDRANPIAISMNAVELRLLHRFELGRQSLAVRLEGGPVTARAFLDYSGKGVFDSTLRRAMSPRISVYGRVYGDYYLVDPDVAGRTNQSGGRLEAGLRLTGKGGAFDVFGGYEKVVDAYPLERRAREWAFVGFRLAN
jgi:hypothetical protein